VQFPRIGYALELSHFVQARITAYSLICIQIPHRRTDEPVMAALQAITGQGYDPVSSVPMGLEVIIMLGLFFDPAAPMWLIVVLLAFPFISHRIRKDLTAERSVSGVGMPAPSC
jgi:hypothetical protein